MVSENFQAVESHSLYDKEVLHNIHTVIILFLNNIYSLLWNTKTVKPSIHCNQRKSFVTDSVVQDTVQN